MPATGPSEKESNRITANQRGGRRPGAGRPKGRLDAKTIEIQDRAKAFAGDALKALVDVAKKSTNDSARVAAATALLDRGFGKAKQAVEHSGEGGGPLLVTVTHRIVDTK